MKISCVIPCYNEESTIANVVGNVKKVKTIGEIIVVDDGSTDKSYYNALSVKAKVIRHGENRGKGAAIKTGIAHSIGDIILFLDADLESISPKKIMAMLKPLENDEADFVKASFTRAGGRITELVVKPLFKVMFPFIRFSQPLSGQFAVKRELIKDLKIDDRWGVDIQILLQLMKQKVRISEVDIGELVHKHHPVENLTIMSEQVIRAILSEMGIIANKHKLIIFDFDRTLIEESSIELVARDFGFSRELSRLRARYRQGKIKDYDITLSLAKFFSGKKQKEIERICNSLTLSKNAYSVIDRLRKRQYFVGIVSVAFSPIIECIAKKVGIQRENIICPELIEKNGVYTGELIAKTKYNSKCCDKIICKADAALGLMKRLGVKREEAIAIGDGKTDECLFRICGLSLAYRPKARIGDVEITHLSEILVYAE